MQTRLVLYVHFLRDIVESFLYVYSHVNDKNKSQDAIFKNQLFSEALELILIGQIIGKKCT